MTAQEKFWILWCPTSDKPPRVRYSSVAEAEKVADIMAQKNPGMEFIVCEAQFGKARSKKVEKTPYTKKPKKPKVVKTEEKKTLSSILDMKLPYHEWRKYGRQVKGGERAITYGDVSHKALFSYSQTEVYTPKGYFAGDML
jgi:hypothetical protein